MECSYLAMVGLLKTVFPPPPKYLNLEWCDVLQCLNTFAVIFTSVDVVPNLVVGGVSSPSFLCVWDKVACVWDKVACVVCPLGLLSIYIVRCIGTPLM